MPGTEDIVIFCAKNTGYNHIYAWDNAENKLIGAWPGVQMNDYDENWYNYTFEKPTVTAFNVIFNNGSGGSGNQTEDLKGIVNGTGYYWYTKADGLIASSSMPNPGAQGTPQTGELRTVEGPGSYKGGVTNAPHLRELLLLGYLPEVLLDDHQQIWRLPQGLPSGIHLFRHHHPLL